MVLTKKQKDALARLTKNVGKETAKVGFFEGATGLAKKQLKNAVDVGAGVAKGVGEFAAGASQIGESAIKATGRVLTPKAFEEKLGFAKSEPSVEKLSQLTTGKSTAELFQPTNTAQKAGKFIADVGAFAVPAGQATKATKAISTAKKLSPLKAGLLDVATQGTVGAGVQATKTGGEDLKDALVVGGLTAGLTGAGKLATKMLPTRKPKNTQEFFAQLRSQGEKAGLKTSTVNKLARSTGEQKTILNRMLQKAIQNVDDVNAERPIVEVGKRLLKDVDDLAKSTKSVGQKLGGIKSNLIKNTKPITSTSAKKALVRDLTNKGVKINAVNGKITFPKSFNTTEQRLVEDALTRLDKMTNTAQAIDFLDEFAKKLDVAKQAGKVSTKTPVEAILTKARDNIKNQVAKISPDYKQLTQNYAQSKQALDKILKAVGKTGYKDQQVLNLKASEIVRPLINRNTSKATDIATDLYKALKIYQPNLKPSQRLSQLTDQVKFSDVLEKAFDLAPESSFVGGIETAGKQLADVAKGGVKEKAFTLIDQVLTKNKSDVAKEVITKALQGMPEQQQGALMNTLLDIMEVGAKGSPYAISSEIITPEQIQSQPSVPTMFTPATTPQLNEPPIPDMFKPF